MLNNISISKRAYHHSVNSIAFFHFLSTLPPDITLGELVAKAHMRWRIERDYQDLKLDLGLGHYEGRGWRGFHHHAVLSIAAYEFLVAERIAAANSPGVKKTPSHAKSLQYPKITFPGEAQRAQRHVQLAHSVKRRTDASLKTARQTFASITLSIRLIAGARGAEP
jgi:hypothetical protein